MDAQADLVIVGAGIAGLTAALTAAERGANVLLLVKGKISAAVSSSWFAQGGVAAVQGADDDLALHIEDTLIAGRGLCRYSAVETLVREIPDRVAELQAWGVPFDDVSTSGTWIRPSSSQISAVPSSSPNMRISGRGSSRVQLLRPLRWMTP